MRGKSDFYVYGLYRDEKMDMPFYIGKGSGRRLWRHEHESEIAKRYNIRKNNIIKKLIAGIGFVPKKIIKGGLIEHEAFALEIALIKQYGRLDVDTGCLVNLSDGGIGAHPSPETIEKCKSAPKRVLSAEHKAKIAAASRGRKHTPEAKAKMSAVQKSIKRHYTAEQRARQSAALKGRKHSLEARASMSRTRKGRKLSAVHVEAIKNGQRGLKRSNEARANMKAARAAFRVKLDAVSVTALSKRCTSCERELPLAVFYEQRDGKYGRKSKCIECVSERSRARYNKSKTAGAECQSMSM